MKTKSLFIAGIASLFIFAGCSSSTQDVLVDDYKNNDYRIAEVSAETIGAYCKEDRRTSFDLGIVQSAEAKGGRSGGSRSSSSSRSSGSSSSSSSTSRNSTSKPSYSRSQSSRESSSSSMSSTMLWMAGGYFLGSAGGGTSAGANSEAVRCFQYLIREGKAGEWKYTTPENFQETMDQDEKLSEDEYNAL